METYNFILETILILTMMMIIIVNIVSGEVSLCFQIETYGRTEPSKWVILRNLWGVASIDLRCPSFQLGWLKITMPSLLSEVAP